MTDSPLQKNNFRCFHRLRVRWAEVDMQKIVFNAHYLMYIDTAVADYWRALAVPYESAMQALGGDIFVKKASVEYFASARYDDVLDIGVRCERVGNSSMQFVAGVFAGEQLLVRGELLYVFANPHSQKAMPVPVALRNLFEQFEAGQQMTQLQVGDWSSLGTACSAVRTAVFVQEQGIPAEMEWDAADALAVHALVCNGLGQGLATGRLLQHAPGVGRIGRMAVLRVLRGGNLGQGVLSALTHAAQARGDHELILHAQTSALGFYAKAGFTPRGAGFEEAGIPHIEMFKILSTTRAKL